MDNVDENLFENIVRTVFRQRRKILGNSLQSLFDKEIIMNVPYVNKRPEQMSVNDFIELANYLGKYVNFK
jgi:16S rRNA (adenine1518-N6/adenine1519-N6)-dimethyltransferase